MLALPPLGDLTNSSGFSRKSSGQFARSTASVYGEGFDVHQMVEGALREHHSRLIAFPEHLLEHDDLVVRLRNHDLSRIQPFLRCD